VNGTYLIYHDEFSFEWRFCIEINRSNLD
jgi:hypothetical protein